MSIPSRWLTPLLAAPLLLSTANGQQASLQVGVIDRPFLPGGGFVDGELIVSFADGTSEAEIEQAVRLVGGVSARRSRFSNRWLVTLEPGLPVPDAVARLETLPDVDFAEPNGRAVSMFTPNDTLFPLQWHMRMVNAERTWDIQRGDPSVAVAIVDSGVAYEDFGPFRKAPDWGSTRFVTGFNAFDGSSHANDDNFHGTHVASTIAEATDNGFGVAGLAFETALMPVKVLDSNGLGRFFDVAEGIDYVTQYRENGVNPVKVINLSLGGPSSCQAVIDSIDAAVASGIVVVAAAGNDSRGRVSFPARLPNVIAVGAVHAGRQRASYSNFGPELDLVAPGGDLDRDDDGDGQPDGVLQQTFNPFTAFFDDRFDDFGFFFVDGTSQAAPHVAAAAALLAHQGITDPIAIQRALEASAEDLGPAGFDEEYGHGLVRIDRALSGLGLNE